MGGGFELASEFIEPIRRAGQFPHQAQANAHLGIRLILDLPSGNDLVDDGLLGP